MGAFALIVVSLLSTRFVRSVRIRSMDESQKPNLASVPGWLSLIFFVLLSNLITSLAITLNTQKSLAARAPHETLSIVFKTINGHSFLIIEDSVLHNPDCSHPRHGSQIKVIAQPSDTKLR